MDPYEILFKGSDGRLGLTLGLRHTFLELGQKEDLKKHFLYVRTTQVKISL